MKNQMSYFVPMHHFPSGYPTMLKNGQIYFKNIAMLRILRCLQILQTTKFKGYFEASQTSKMAFSQKVVWLGSKYASEIPKNFMVLTFDETHRGCRGNVFSSERESVRIRSFSGRFPVFSPNVSWNTDQKNSKYGHFLRSGTYSEEYKNSWQCPIKLKMSLYHLKHFVRKCLREVHFQLPWSFYCENLKEQLLLFGCLFCFRMWLEGA